MSNYTLLTTSQLLTTGTAIREQTNYLANAIVQLLGATIIGTPTLTTYLSLNGIKGYSAALKRGSRFISLGSYNGEGKMPKMLKARLNTLRKEYNIEPNVCPTKQDAGNYQLFLERLDKVLFNPETKAKASKPSNAVLLLLGKMKGATEEVLNLTPEQGVLWSNAIKALSALDEGGVGFFGKSKPLTTAEPVDVKETVEEVEIEVEEVGVEETLPLLPPPVITPKEKAAKAKAAKARATKAKAAKARAAKAAKAAKATS